MTEYPYVIRATPSVLSQWAGDEEASWEDHDGPTTGHVYPILTRRKNAIEIQSSEEAQLLLKSAHYHGDLMAWDWDGRHAYRKAVRGLYTQIAAHEGLEQCINTQMTQAELNARQVRHGYFDGRPAN